MAYQSDVNVVSCILLNVLVLMVLQLNMKWLSEPTESEFQSFLWHKVYFNGGTFSLMP